MDKFLLFYVSVEKLPRAAGGRGGAVGKLQFPTQ